MKTGTEILKGIEYLSMLGTMEIFIEGLSMSSGDIKPGWAFFACPGTNTDGHQYIPNAVSKGAKLIVCERIPDKISKEVTYVSVPDSKKALGTAAANFYDHPSKELKLIGITGTNGKTTVATLCYQLFTELGYSCGLLSTIHNLIQNKVYPSTHTTSDAVSINKMLREMVANGCEYAFMEVSSHAIDQDRIHGIHFTGGVFTNITHDHLDYHKTFQNYIYAKKKFFDHLPENAFALINADDKRGDVMLQNCAASHHTFALKTPSDFHGKILESDFSGLLLTINRDEVHCRMIGRFNAYNILSAYGVANLLGKEKLEVLKTLSMLPGAEGRFDRIQSPKEGIIGIVDYAHTPDALKNVLETVNEVKSDKEKLITVFGCGGDRDRDKRPRMGLIASELSHVVIITSDNPRSEEPISIINQIKQGVPKENTQKVFIQPDRKEAIRMAVAMAYKGDIIMIAGKGHEKYQEIKGVKSPFDDKAILQSTFQEMKK